MKHLLSIILVLVASTGYAQTRKTYDLAADFGLSPMQSQATLTNIGTEAAARAKYPRVFARFEGLGRMTTGNGPRYAACIRLCDLNGPILC